MPEIPPPGKYTGETPFVEAACEALGLPHVHPGLLTAMQPFRVLASLAVQAHMAPAGHRPAIAREAAKQLDVLAVATAAARAIIAHLNASVGLPAPADPAAGLAAKVAELEAGLGHNAGLLDLATRSRDEALERAATWEADAGRNRARVAELEAEVEKLTAPAPKPSPALKSASR